VIRAAITKPDKEPTSWCFAIIGQRARKVSRRTALKIVRARWHLEDTAFNQWVQHWNFATCLGTRRMLCWPSCCFGRWLQSAAAVYLSPAETSAAAQRSHDTIRHLVEVMLREVATLPSHSFGRTAGQ